MQETSPFQGCLGLGLGLAFFAALFAGVVGVVLFVVLKAAASDRAKKLQREEEWSQRQAEVKRIAAERTQREAEEERRRAIAQHAAEQQGIIARLDNLISDSNRKAGGLSGLLRSTEERIDDAEGKLKEGSFVPFWESIEKATAQLANFDTTLRALIHNSQFYEKEAMALETTPPPFQIGLDTLPDATRTYTRMESLVRQAHKDRDFANIYQQRQIYYEQCKTNALLEWGFSSLGQALIELGDRLDSSLKQLASSVNVEISKLGLDLMASQEQLKSTLSARLERLQDQNARDAKAQREGDARSAKKTHEMLDDIRRRRKPLPPGLRDGEY